MSEGSDIWPVMEEIGALIRLARSPDCALADRHEATRMADAGAEPFTPAAILGYSDIRMTARYTHATDQAKRRVVDNLVKPESDSDASEPDY